jgi:hypothetical protein
MAISLNKTSIKSSFFIGDGCPFEDNKNSTYSTEHPKKHPSWMACFDEESESDEELESDKELESDEGFESDDQDESEVFNCSGELDFTESLGRNQCPKCYILSQLLLQLKEEGHDIELDKAKCEDCLSGGIRKSNITRKLTEVKQFAEPKPKINVKRCDHLLKKIAGGEIFICIWCNFKCKLTR